MKESTKTLTLICAAALLAAVAYATRPRLPFAQNEGEVGQPLFPEWKDPAAAKSITITSFDEATGSLHTPFKVADVNGRWVIPSHYNYPANAEQTVQSIAAKLINLTIIGVVSNDRGAQETYGVVEPDENKLTTGASGVGKRVVVQDEAGKDLCRLIIGQEDKSHSEDGPANLRYVRRAGQDRIYRVSLATDQLSTKFQDWIDTDLLNLKQHWDITELKLRDYSLDNNALARKWDLDLDGFDQQKNAWNIKQFTTYKNNQPTSAKLGPDEELDNVKINDLKTNVSGMKIVDVVRKPAGFIAKLKAGQSFLDDPDAQKSLEQCGIIAFPDRNPTELLSLGGDMTIGMKDGVEYTIHFGGAGVTFSEGAGKKPDKSDKNSKQTEVQRVVFVTARFNQDLIPKPVLEPLPEVKKAEPGKPDATKPAGKEPPATAPTESKPTESKPAEPKPTGAKPADKAAPEKAAPEKTAPDKGAPKSSATTKPELLLALADDPKSEAAKPASDAKPAEPKAAEPKATEPKAAEPKTAEPKTAEPKTAEPKTAEPKTAEPKTAEPKTAAPKAAPKADDKKPADKKPDVAPPDASGKPPAPAPKSDIQRAQEEHERDAEHKRIETANKLKQDQYDTTVKQGKSHAKELSNRFADWFYLISEDDYKKVHVTRAEIIKKKAGEAGLSPGPADPFKLPKLPGAGH